MGLQTTKFHEPPSRLNGYGPQWLCYGSGVMVRIIVIRVSLHEFPPFREHLSRDNSEGISWLYMEYTRIPKAPSTIIVHT